jgi:hypothetical protein
VSETSLHDTGLPTWLFTPRMAVASGIAFAVVVIAAMNVASFIGGALDRTDFNAAPLCFNIKGTLAAGTGRFDRNAFDAKRIAGARKMEVAKVLPAAVECKPEACSSTARERYRQVVRWYLVTRSEAASTFYARYGDVGLTYARWVYDEDEDREIIAGLRKRYGAGLFDIRTMTNGGHNYIDATRMLLFGNAQAFKPCVKE